VTNEAVAAVTIPTVLILAMIGMMWRAMEKGFQAVDKRLEAVDRRF